MRGFEYLLQSAVNLKIHYVTYRNRSIKENNLKGKKGNIFVLEEKEYNFSDIVGIPLFTSCLD